MSIALQEPLTYPLLAVAKKYVHLLSKRTGEFSIDKYQYVLIVIDDHQGKLTQKVLADSLQIDKSYMVNILDYLCNMGYTRREKNPSDRREQLVKLTDKGREDIPKIRAVINQMNGLSLKDISEDKLKIFNEVLSTITRNLNQL